MDDSNNILAEVRSLFDALCQADLSPGQGERLEHLLMTSEEALGYYLELVHQHAALRLILGPTFRTEMEEKPFSFAEFEEPAAQQKVPPDDRQAGGVETAPERMDVLLSKESLPSVPTSASMPHEETLVAPGGKNGSFSFLPVAPLMSLVCAGGLVAVILMIVWMWPRGRGNLGEEFANQVQIPRQDSVSADLPLNIGKLRIGAETVHMRLPHVGQLIIDGPADLELVTPMRLRLNRGQIRVRVTEPEGRGFTVVTEHGEVTDLGTEFGVGVSDKGKAEVVVFDGTVDLHVDQSEEPVDSLHVERLVRGEGVVFQKHGKIDRIMSIVTGTVDTFQQNHGPTTRGPTAVILEVTDNLRVSETKKYYEIVPHGLQEDALAYVDRIGHEWNGLTEAGLPRYLLGADYVKTFMHDRQRKDMTIEVTLSCPAMLYIFYDHRLPPPEWLKKEFRLTPDFIGIDNGPFRCAKDNPRQVRGKGPGQHVDDTYDVWERIVPQAGIVKLGPNNSFTNDSAMYGIAAVALPPPPETSGGKDQQ